MASDVSICNRALALLGAQTIVSLDADQTEAEVMNAIYADARDAVLREARPACATFRTTLAKMSEAPAFGYANQFQLPTSPYCLMVLDMDEDANYIVEDRRILTDSATCSITYIGQVTDAGMFDSATVFAIAARCAAEASYALAQNGSLTDRMWALSEKAVLDAQSADAMERGTDAIEVTQFANARL